MSDTDLLMAIKDLKNAIRGTLYPEDVERRRVVLNDSGETPTLFEANAYRGKEFQHGCQGWIEKLRFYARNTGTAEQDIIFGFTGAATGSDRFTVTYPCPAGTDGFVEVNVRKQWNIYSCFVYVQSIGADCSIGYLLEAEFPDAYESDDSGTTWAHTTDGRNYPFQLTIGQAATMLRVGGHVSIEEVDKHVKVVLTDEDGNIIGVGLPLNATTIIGSSDTSFNSLADDGEVQKSYAAGDPFTGEWSSGRAIYPYAVNIVFRVDHNSNLRPPNFLEYDGIYVRLTTSDGQLLFDDMLGNDRNFNFNLMTWGGSLFWVATLRAELGYRRVSAGVTMTLLVKNSSGVTLDFVEPYIMGATIPS